MNRPDTPAGVSGSVPDLAAVAPERRAEVRRRIDAITRFLDAPGRAAAEREAAAVGLSVARFYNLVRSWKAVRQPDALSGLGRARSKPTRLSTQAASLIGSEIAAGERLPVSQVIDTIVEKGGASGIVMPDRRAIGRLVRRGRPALLAEQMTDGADVIVDHTVLDLPVRFGDRARRPLATMVIDARREIIVGLALSSGTPSAAAIADALLDAMRTGGDPDGTGAGIRVLAITGMAPNEIEALPAALSTIGIETRLLVTGAHGGGLRIEALLGDRRAGIQMRPRLIWHSGERRWATGRGGGVAPMNPTDAVEFARARLLGAGVDTGSLPLTEQERSTLRPRLLSLAHPDPAAESH